MAFESKEESIQRHNLMKFEQKERKSPVAKFDNMEWDQEAMKVKVMSYEDGTLEIWSELGRRYGIKNTNGCIAQNANQMLMYD